MLQISLEALVVLSFAGPPFPFSSLGPLTTSLPLAHRGAGGS